MWTYKGQPINQLPEGCVGFVYLITDLATGLKYIGKKSRYSRTSKPPLRGKSKRRYKTTEMDWINYWSSSELVQALVQEHGVQRFRREILHLCYSKAELSYLELREQMDRRVLESDQYMNSQIMARAHKRHIFGKIQS